VAFIEGPPHRADLKTERFVDDEIVPVASPGHPMVRAAEELQRLPLILRERGSGTRNVVELTLKKAGLRISRLRIAMELDSSEAIKSAVEAGLGIGFVSRWALRNELQLATLKVLKIPGLRIARRFNFLYPQGPEPSGPAGVFLRYARDYGRSLSVGRGVSPWTDWHSP
jgi:DNA-binding transcriptional LysR family regulator